MNLANQDLESANIILTRTLFEESRYKELDSLFNYNIFKVVDKIDLLPDSQIFRSRFINKIKFISTEKVYKKSRLIIQGYNNISKREILT